MKTEKCSGPPRRIEKVEGPDKPILPQKQGEKTKERKRAPEGFNLGTSIPVVQVVEILLGPKKKKSCW